MIKHTFSTLAFLCFVIFANSCQTFYISKDDLVSQLQEHQNNNPSIKDTLKKYKFRRTNDLDKIVCYHKNGSKVALWNDERLLFKVKVIGKKKPYHFSTSEISYKENYLKGSLANVILKKQKIKIDNIESITIINTALLSQVGYMYIEQSDTRLEKEKQKEIRDSLRNLRTINFVGVMPSNFKRINGWAIDFAVLELDEYNTREINGLYTNTLLIQSIFVIMGGSMWLATPAKDRVNLMEELETGFPDSLMNRINGLSISLADISPTYITNGLQVNGFGYFGNVLNGIGINGIVSGYDSFNGLQISGIYSYANKGKGIQIGLFNKAKKMKGIQIGLWNKIGKRGFPLINFSFKRDKNKTRKKK